MAIKRPIIPSHLLDDDAEVAEEIVTVPADAVGRDEQVRADDLDVPDRAEVLLELLREEQGGHDTRTKNRGDDPSAGH